MICSQKTLVLYIYTFVYSLFWIIFQFEHFYVFCLDDDIVTHDDEKYDYECADDESCDDVDVDEGNKIKSLYDIMTCN